MNIWGRQYNLTADLISTGFSIETFTKEQYDDTNINHVTEDIDMQVVTGDRFMFYFFW